MATASAAGGDRPLAVLAAVEHVEAVGLHGVVAGPAEDDVAAFVGHVDLVVARADPVRVAAAEELVVTGLPEDHVCAVLAEHLVVAGTRIDHVRPATAGYLVVARPADHQVLARPAVDRVVPRAALEIVVPGAAHDLVVAVL